MRPVFGEDGWYIDKGYPLKRAYHQEDKYEDLLVTSDHIKFKVKFLLVVQRLWPELDDKDRYFFVSYNRKVNHNKYTDENDVPASESREGLSPKSVNALKAFVHSSNNI